MFEPIPEQKSIIDSRNKNIIVSASAGSGKTTVMIARICDLLLKREAKVSELLVLTYTKAAANEMKERLHKELQKHLDENSFLEEEIEALPTAEISTIHSFCQRLLKKHFHFAGLDPSFEVLEEQQATLFKKRALTTVLEKFKKERPDDYFLLLKNYGKSRSDKKIVNLILEIDKFFEGIVDEEYYKKNIAFYLYENQDQALQIINHWICDCINYNKASFENLLQVCADEKATKYVEFLNQIISAISIVSYEKNFYQNLDAVLNLKLPTFKKEENYNENLTEQISQQKTSLSKYISNLKLKNFAPKNSLSQTFESGKVVLGLLLELQQKFKTEFEKIKRENNCVDFSNLEKFAIKLAQKSEIADELKNQFKYIFVDEFQDANDVQEYLLSLLSGPNNRFMVGDVKQSIYGFRNSNPDIFLSLQERYEMDKNSESRLLKTNFRSEKKIVEFVNFVFDKIMTMSTAKVDYKKHARLQAFFESNPSELPKVEIVVFEKSKKPPKEKVESCYSVEHHQEFDEEASMAEKEAIKVAEDILKFKNSYIYDKGEKRKVKFEDITILFRKRGDYFEKFCAKLVELGVPIFANSSQNLFEENDVKKLVWFLMVCQNYKQDYPLVATMTSPFGKFSYEELAQIRQEFIEEEFFHNCVLNYKNQKQDELAKKLNNFFEFLNDIWFEIEINGVYEGLTKAINQTDYLSFVLPQENGGQRLASIEKFLDRFKNSSFNRGVFSFLKFVEIQDGEIKAPDFFLADNDCVNITTIHSSKGLEYPIVFFVKAGDYLSNEAGKEEIEIHESLGIGLKFYDEEENQKYSSPVYESLKIKNQDKEFAEKLRLLYVGLTRAKNHLNIYGTVDTVSILPLKKDYEIKAQNSFLKLVLGALNKDQIKELRKNKKINLFDDPDFQITIVDENKESENTNKKQILFGKANIEIKNYFKQNLPFKYQNPEVYDITLKNSVSSLAFSSEYESFNLTPQKFTLDEHLNFDKESAEAGSLYHKALEKLDFSKKYDDEKLILELNAIFKPEEIEKIEIKKVLKVLEILNNLFKNQKVFKEKKFIMKVPYKEVAQSNIEDEILVQGVIDAFCLGENPILVDFKLTNSPKQIIKNRYAKQIELYKKAIQKRYNINNLKTYILLINQAELIEM